VRWRCSFCTHLAASESAWEDHRRRSHPKPRRDFAGALAPYLTQASAYGVDQVFDAAFAEAKQLSSDPRERVRLLALLGRRLREIDGRWCSPIGMERAILCHEQGHDAQTIADLVGVTKATVQRRIRSVLHGPRLAEITSQAPENIGALAAFPAREGTHSGHDENARRGEVA
jgi:hypothetical protein